MGKATLLFVLKQSAPAHAWIPDMTRGGFRKMNVDAWPLWPGTSTPMKLPVERADLPVLLPSD